MYNTSSSTVHPYFIDDRDPRIKYTAAWRKFGSDPDFQHTSQGSTFAGDSFSLQFEGKSISYYAGINNGSVGEVLNASIVIDGGPPTFFVPGVQPEAVTTNNLIFNSGDLSEGNHTLVVTAENDHTVWTDYFLVTPNTRTPTSNPLPLTSGPSSPPTASTAASTSPPKTARSTPIGMIVGLVISGLILVALGAAHLYRATLDVDGIFYCVSGFSHTVAGGFRSAEEPDERSTGANRDITEQ
ncbi:hypothetical protein B0H14DRAFT_3876539 [Mycena olivaceomarginata]|nr:hypothetical protein B0H14DRAFT_3876539 [Mycena olivaceomarginata]